MKSRLISLVVSTLTLVSSQLWAADLSPSFKTLYNSKPVFTYNEQHQLKNFDFYLVPGILSETFISADPRSRLNFARWTGDYFGAQEKYLRDAYGFKVQRLSSSSKSVAEIRGNIRRALLQSQRNHRQALFITHSLGGLALLHELVLNSEVQKSVAGVIFLQSPFYGTPMADVYFKNVFQLSLWLRPALPFFNTSEDTLDYLRTVQRIQFMAQERDNIQKMLSKIPVITLGGVIYKQKSLFSPAADIMQVGCVEGFFSQCASPKFLKGPFDDSDGMVPFSSSRLENTDFVKLEGVDHGETVVRVPYQNYRKEPLTVTMLKLLIPKIK